MNGVVPIGDAWASTNPSLGRGLSIGLMQVVRLGDVLRLALDPVPFAKEWARVVPDEFDPWYRCTVRTDADRIAEIDALREERRVPPATDPAALLRLAAVLTRDPELFRALFDLIGVLALPGDVLARPDVRSRLDALGPVFVGAFPLPGPDRRQLLALIVE